MVGSRVAIIFLVLALSASSHVAVVQCHQPTHKSLILVALKGMDGDEATLALRTDDVSLVGFANRSHHWYSFPGNEHLLPTSTPLPFGNSYRDLIGGLNNLPGVPLGKASTLQATRVLSNNDLAIAGDHEPLKRALAALTVITCEAQRLKAIKETVQKGWETDEARVAPEHLPYIEHWDTICYEVLRAQRTGEWSGPFTELLRKSANIHSKDEALAIVDLQVERTFEDLLVAHARSAAA